MTPALRPGRADSPRSGAGGPRFCSFPLVLCLYLLLHLHLFTDSYFLKPPPPACGSKAALLLSGHSGAKSGHTALGDQKLPCGAPKGWARPLPDRTRQHGGPQRQGFNPMWTSLPEGPIRTPHLSWGRRLQADLLPSPAAGSPDT